MGVKPSDPSWKGALGWLPHAQPYWRGTGRRAVEAEGAQHLPRAQGMGLSEAWPRPRPTSQLKPSIFPLGQASSMLHLYSSNDELLQLMF